jgi:superfamily II DNA or RNA helicase
MLEDKASLTAESAQESIRAAGGSGDSTRGLAQLELNGFFDAKGSGVHAVRDFLEPHLSHSSTYDRVAGYFSSSVIATAARGLSKFVARGGKMRLLTSKDLTEIDYSTLDAYLSGDVDSDLISEIGWAIDRGTPEAFRNHLAAMCWMLREGVLEIRIVVSVNQDTSFERFHSKFGLFQDEFGNTVAFSGSINETTSAWTRNYENFDVFQSWVPEREAYVTPKSELFESLWTLGNHGSWETIRLPQAVEQHLINEFAPPDFPDLESSSNLPNSEKGKLRQYQLDAIASWEAAGRVGILEMATGTGKTKTACACIERSSNLGSLLTVIIAPYQHICDQWAEELAASDPVQTSGKWKAGIQQRVTDVALGRAEHLTVIAVKNTASRRDFTELIDSIRGQFDNFLLIGDEVHWLGATSYRPAMRESANFRLGLSATPERYFDDVGTEEIMHYFQQTVYELSLGEALRLRQPNGDAVLTPYEYDPVFVSLDDDEQELYEEFSKKIRRLKNIPKHATPAERADAQAKLENLYIQRASILKTAKSKIPALMDYLETAEENLSDCLIYCADNTQLEQVASLLLARDIHTQKITSEVGTIPEARFGGVSERQYIINNFEKGNLEVLLAISCLDEGVDIPSARLGFILASSGNSKEFIQRRGRLMRPFPGKTLAQIVDFCVIPDDSFEGGQAIVTRELRRVREFGADAENSQEIESLVQELEVETSDA